MQNKAFHILLFIFLFSSLYINAQEKFRVMFYNVENLYDTKDNPATNDDDLTPTGNLYWNNYKYWKKQHSISKVLLSVGNNYPPALIGLCEIENDSVLYDLTNRTNLRKHKYRYVITNSKDFRGSNTALLYQRDQFKLLRQNAYTPFIDSVRTTRDILHVSGKVINGDTLDIFICHFPSRSEGIKKTRPFRIRCAVLLKQKTDSIFSVRRKANIIVMGDFNDYPNDISMKEVLKGKSISEKTEPKDLYNMFYHKISDKSIGSYKYRGKWNYVDQFIVSGNLLNSKYKTSIKNREASTFSADFFLEKDNKKYGGLKPFRTYSGWKYLGGYSDHLPIYFDLLIRK